MSTERLISIMLLVAVVLSVMTFIDGYTREQARLEAAQHEE